MNSEFRFVSLTLEDCPPLGTRSIHFGQGLNLVTGKNGCGKTSVIQALKTGKWPYGGRATVCSEGERECLTTYADLAFLDGRDVGLMTDGQSRPPWFQRVHEDPAILASVSSRLSAMIRNKLGVSLTKFSRIPYCGPDTFSVSLGKQGGIEVHPGPGLLAVHYESPYGTVEDLFVAMGERTLLALCAIMAAREHYCLKVPLILDDIVGGLDDYHVSSMLLLLQSLDCQVILSMDREYAQRPNHLRTGETIIDLATPSSPE